MQLLLAGGAGFVGSRLAERLIQDGHDVVILDNLLTGRLANLDGAHSIPGSARLRFVRGDVSRPPGITCHFDAVLHLASPASPRDYFQHPVATLEAGSLGTRNLLERARRDGARFMLASTSEVYGDPQVHPQPESYWGYVNPQGPRSVYDEAKRFSEAMAACYARSFGVQVRIARIFNTYGPRMRIDDGRMIPTFVSQALNNEPLTVQGDGLHTRSLCYVDDLVDGLVRLLWSDCEGAVNLGSSDEHTVLDIAQTIIQLTGSSSPVAHVAEATDDPQRRRPELTRARTELGWAARMPLPEGLERTIQYFRRSAVRPEAPPVSRNGTSPGARPTVRGRVERAGRNGWPKKIGSAAP